METIDKIDAIKQEVQRLLKKVHLNLNEKKTKSYILNKTNHVRITGVSITKDEKNYRHISVGRKLKNQIFWNAINMHDQEIKDYVQIEHLKGIFSFALSIEKKDFEACYSKNMKQLIKERGYDSLRDLIKDLGNDNKSMITN